MLPMISHLGAMISVVNGALMAHRFQGRARTVGAASIGDGGTSTGAFHEGINQAAVEKLPLVLVVTNNQYAYSTPNSRQFACRDLVEKAPGYGIDGHCVDGTDLGACLQVIGDAVERARDGAGPQMVVASNLRLSGHGEHDDGHYVDETLRNRHLGRDCLDLAQEAILANQWADRETLDLWRRDCVSQVDEAVAHAQREAAPDPANEDWCCLHTRSLMEGLA
jgi:pyruvate dehydrogenase E1 component alpha subunit/2-oxoisovalerate dehydrogenase E1 component alpha subunit